MSHEIELKLTLSEADARRLGRLEAVRSRVRGRARRRKLVSTYFDTPDQRLRSAGVAVRIRRVGRTRLLCVKAGQTTLGGVLVRREWEGPVQTDVPTTADIGAADLRAMVEKLIGSDLRPVFVTTMTRVSRDLDLGDGATAVMDVDVGTVEGVHDQGRVTDTAGDPHAANAAEAAEASVDATRAVDHVCELELELKTGDPAKLFDVARAIAETVAVRVSTDTKAARGFRLLDGLLPQPLKAKGLALKPSASVETSLAQVVQGCLDQVLSNERPVLVNDDPEGVHQMRVGLRRLRSALTLFKRVIPDEQRSALNDEVRWLTGELGGARDADVQAEEIIGPVAAHMRASGMEDSQEFAHLMALIADERRIGRAAARAAVASRRFTALVLDLSAWLANNDVRKQPLSQDSALLFRPVPELACRLLAQRHKKVVRRARRYADLPIAEKHELRKDVKRLRYACEFFRALYAEESGRTGKAVKAYGTRLAGLQDVLGYLNDVAVAEEYIAHLIARSEREGGHDLRYVCGVVLGWHQHALAIEEPRIVSSVRAFLRAKPFWS